MAKPDVSKYRDRMDKAVATLKDEFAGLRTGRASAGLLEPVMVEAYGSHTLCMGMADWTRVSTPSFSRAFCIARAFITVASMPM